MSGANKYDKKKKDGVKEIREKERQDGGGVGLPC